MSLIGNIKNHFLLQWLFVFISINTHAHGTSYCSKNYIESFETSELKQFENLDYCRLESPPAAIKKTIIAFGEVIRNAARLFKVKPEELLQKNIPVVLSGKGLGPLDGYTDGLFLEIGVFPDWDGSYIPSGVFAHELGHVLTTIPGRGLPESMPSLRDTYLFGESFSDFLAYALTGSISSAHPGLPDSITKIRDFNSKYTFNAPLALYEKNYFGRHLHQECLNLNFQHASKHVHDLCSALAFFYVERPVENRTLKLSDFKYYGVYQSEIDPHLIGLAINSFIFETQDGQYKKIIQNYVLALKKLDQTKKTVRCFYNTKNIEVSTYNYEEFINFFHSNLFPWNKYDMNTALHVASSDKKARAIIDALEKFGFGSSTPTYQKCMENPSACEISCQM